MITASATAISDFLGRMSAERGAAANTLEAYGRDLGEFADYLADQGLALGETGPNHITAYLRHLDDLGLAASSRARKLSAIRQLFRFLEAEGQIAANPAEHVMAPAKGRTLPRTLNVAEVDRLLSAAHTCVTHAKGRERLPALRLAALLELLYATGMRVSELVSLPRRVLAGDDRVLTITGKGGRERLVPLNGPARTAVAAYLAEEAAHVPAPHVASAKWLFPAASEAGHVTRQHLGQELKAVAEAGRDRSRAGQPARAAACVREPSAGSRRGFARGAAAAGARGYLDDADLYACAGGAAEAGGDGASSVGEEGGVRGRRHPPCTKY